MSSWREKEEARRAAASASAGIGVGEAGPASAGITKKSKKNARRGGKSAKKKTVKPKKGNSSLRSKIRGLERTLAHQGEAMTPAARKAKQDEIESLKALFEDRKRRERERTLAKKYHMVKFFERRKLMRRLEKVAELSKLPDADMSALEARKKNLEDDLAYVVNFPKDRPYVALFPSEGHSEETRAAVEKIRAEMKAISSGKPEEMGTEDPVDEFEADGAVLDVDAEDDFFLDADD